MSEQINLKDAEKRTLSLALFRDGLWDILLGCMLVALSLYPILRRALGPALNALLLIAILSILAAAWYVAKRHITTPRIGRVRLGITHRTKIRRLQIITLALVLATVALWILVQVHAIGEAVWAGAPDWVREFDTDILFAVIIIGLFSLMAAVLGIRRLHLYGWLFGLGNLGSTILEAELSLTFLFPLAIAGGIIVLVGGATLARFLHNYPIATAGQ
jgi:hypothetical protein